MIGRNSDISCALDPEDSKLNDSWSTNISSESAVCQTERSGDLDHDERIRRDAIAVRKANELAAEVGHDYKIPVIWDKDEPEDSFIGGCISLPNYP